MMTNVRNLVVAAALVAAVAGTSRAASISIALLNSDLTVAAGQTVVFSGTITNTEAVTIDLNGCFVNAPGTLTGDCTTGLFFDNAPFTLDAGDTTPVIDLFSITVDPLYSGPYGHFSGNFQVLGNVEVGGVYDGGVQNLLGQQTFDVNILSPEPGTWMGLAGGLGLLMMLRRRR